MALYEINQSEVLAEQLIPEVRTDVFVSHEAARFWVGKIATIGQVDRPEEFLSARRLSANVYIDKMGFLGEESREADGGETDEDDSRSTQFVVIERVPETGATRTVGRSRLIHKMDHEEILPVEAHFPEAFSDDPVPIGSVEASRFVAEHPTKLTKHLISFAGIRAMDLEAVRIDAPAIYAVIEEPLAARFDSVGLPYERISGFKRLASYNNTLNTAVKIDPLEVKNSIRGDSPEQLLLRMFFESSIQNNGLGYFDETLIAGVENA